MNDTRAVPCRAVRNEVNISAGVRLFERKWPGCPPVCISVAVPPVYISAGMVVVILAIDPFPALLIISGHTIRIQVVRWLCAVPCSNVGRWGGGVAGWSGGFGGGVDMVGGCVGAGWGAAWGRGGVGRSVDVLHCTMRAYTGWPTAVAFL